MHVGMHPAVRSKPATAMGPVNGVRDGTRPAGQNGRSWWGIGADMEKHRKWRRKVFRMPRSSGMEGLETRRCPITPCRD